MTSPIGSSAMSSSAFGLANANANARPHAWTQGDAPLAPQGQAGAQAVTSISDRVGSVPNELPLERASFGGHGPLAQMPDGCGCVRSTAARGFSALALGPLEAAANLLVQAFSFE